jgi:hypothetical protein
MKKGETDVFIGITGESLELSQIPLTVNCVYFCPLIILYNTASAYFITGESLELSQIPLTVNCVYFCPFINLYNKASAYFISPRVFLLYTVYRFADAIYQHAIESASRLRHDLYVICSESFFLVSCVRLDKKI